MSGIDTSMLDLFRQEIELATPVLTSGLIELEKGKSGADITESLMRTAHSAKGAARMVGVDPVVRIAHIMEDCFVALQEGKTQFNADAIDTLLTAVDVISMLAQQDKNAYDDNYSAFSDTIEATISSLQKINTADENIGHDQKQQNSSNAGVMHDLFIADSISLLEKLKAEIQGDGEGIMDSDQVNDFTSIVTSIKSGAKLAGIKPVVTICTTLLEAISENKTILLDAAESIIQNLINYIEDIGNINQTSSTELFNTISSEIKRLTTTLDTSATVDSKKAEAVSVSADEEYTETHSGQAIKVSSSRLNKLVALAGESVVESRWVRDYANSMLQHKKRQAELVSEIDRLRNYVDDTVENEYLKDMINDIQSKAGQARGLLNENLVELEEYDRRTTGLAQRLNHEVLTTRMRPFSDCTHGFERMVRDLARSLGKTVSLEITGDTTQVDRDILERIDAPLNHILRNAVDHGIETPEQRIAAGKSEAGSITIEAAHNMGMLSIIVCDDGQGINTDALKSRIVEKNLVSEAMANTLSEQELLEFLYLPSFSTRENVTELSGRGVGLDVVHSTIQEMRGQIRTINSPGKGMRIQLLLPLTLSIVRSLLVNISGQTYAFPLARIGHIFTLTRDQIHVIEDKQYFNKDGQNISLIDASQILEVKRTATPSDTYPVVMIGDRNNYFGIVVNDFIGERDLSVHLIDPRLGKIRDISAAALMEDGTPVMIVDIDDMLRSIDILVSGERLNKVKRTRDELLEAASKRVLVVDDSITVREVQRKLLEAKGYDVDIAVDGMDGWNTIRSNKYDLVISDIDMPRMNGIEFVTMIKQDPGLKHIPVMIVSYKDRDEDRDAGLQAGADYYLTKGSFHDESLIEAVSDLIGEA